MKLWSFFPDKPHEWVYRPYVPGKVRKKPNAWVAPEHGKSAMGMERKFPVDDKGLPVPGRDKELIIDKRPTIMLPPRKLRYPF